MPKSGNDGSLVLNGDEVCDVVALTIDDDVENQPYVSSKTGGKTKRIKGNEDWSITMDVLLVDGAPVQKPGGTPTITKGEEVTGSVFTFEGEGFDFEGIIGNIGTPVDIEGGSILRAGVLIEGNGDLTPIP